MSPTSENSSDSKAVVTLICIHTLIYISLCILFIIIFFNIFILIFFFWSYCRAGGILVVQPGIKPVFHAVGTQSPNHWTAGEAP